MPAGPALVEMTRAGPAFFFEAASSGLTRSLLHLGQGDEVPGAVGPLHEDGDLIGLGGQLLELGTLLTAWIL